MDLQYTLEAYAMQLKNVPRTLVAVAGVVQKIIINYLQSSTRDRPLAIFPRRIVLTSPLFSAILYPSSWTGVLTWCFPRQVLSSTFRTVLAGRRAIPRLTYQIHGNNLMTG